MYSFLKRLFVGRPIPTSEQEHQRLPKTVALPVFASDALSSTAYATEEILFVTAVGASSLALGLARPVSISAGVAAIISLPVFHGLDGARVPLALGLLGLITLANLRGMKESGVLF